MTCTLYLAGERAADERHQCAEVQRSEHRRWLRLLGTRHDVQIWTPDERAHKLLNTLLCDELSCLIWDLFQPFHTLFQKPSDGFSLP